MGGENTLLSLTHAGPNASENPGSIKEKAAASTLGMNKGLGEGCASLQTAPVRGGRPCRPSERSQSEPVGMEKAKGTAQPLSYFQQDLSIRFLCALWEALK